MSANAELLTRDPAIPEKIRSRHCDRQAVVYDRQSTLRQVEHNRESTRLQYGLADRTGSQAIPTSSPVSTWDDTGKQLD